ncbi:hypothetical protein [Kumtagia ephedrae]|uniref:DUF4148 domain-containing protein n=1 Tax=Kumtagia ephedrae TaxID=2116701 RepID=A0A2P7SSY6_9HYPH|nr:hypothetical protein [Mesorhizobium ephedrae]PSJ65586.1 hypothetical protein C7I84_00150 [Mesorhizobium ephedrae]
MTVGYKSSPAAMCRAGLAAVLVSILAGCASSASDTAMPLVPQRGPLNTGTYPNLNVPPQVAAPPMTDEDKGRVTARIQSAQSAQATSGRGVGTTGDPRRLQKLAEEHGGDTLKAIEAQ